MHVKASLLEIRPDPTNLFGLSVSKAKTFDDCKAKYKFTYIEKLPRKEWDFLVFGKFAHEILERFHQRLIDLPEQDLAVLMSSCFKEAMANYILTAEQKKDVWAIMNSYLQKMMAPKTITDSKAKVLAVEKKFYIDLDNKILLNGFIDRISLNEDGITVVSDYKTTKNPKYLKNDFFQLLTYAFVLMVEDESMTHVIGEYIMLRHDFKSIPKMITREEVFNTIPQKFLKYAESISEEKVFRPNPNFLCKFCDFQDKCKEGSAYLQKRGLIEKESKISFGLSKW